MGMSKGINLPNLARAHPHDMVLVYEIFFAYIIVSVFIIQDDEYTKVDPEMFCPHTYLLKEYFFIRHFFYITPVSRGTAYFLLEV